MNLCNFLSHGPRAEWSPRILYLEPARYLESGSLVVEPGHPGGRGAERELFPELAGELARLKVDVIVSTGSVATGTAEKTIATIPIVLLTGNPGS